MELTLFHFQTLLPMILISPSLAAYARSCTSISIGHTRVTIVAVRTPALAFRAVIVLLIMRRPVLRQPKQFKNDLYDVTKEKINIQCDRFIGKVIQ